MSLGGRTSIQFSNIHFSLRGVSSIPSRKFLYENRVLASASEHFAWLTLRDMSQMWILRASNYVMLLRSGKCRYRCVLREEISLPLKFDEIMIKYEFVT